MSLENIFFQAFILIIAKKDCQYEKKQKQNTELRLMRDSLYSLLGKSASFKKKYLISNKNDQFQVHETRTYSDDVGESSKEFLKPFQIFLFA